MRRYQQVLLGALIFWGINMLIANASPQDRSQPVSDAEITNTIKKRLAYDESIHLDQVQTITSDGVVTLVGTVDHLLAKRKATRISEAVLGARAIINRLEVNAQSRDDQLIERDIETAVQNSPALKDRQIVVNVNNGQVLLNGQTASKAESQIARRIAAGVVGVRDVSSSIRVEYPESRSDREIKADVESRLSSSAQIIGNPIRVSVSNGEVRLEGGVATARQKRVASSLAFVTGVASVNADDLKIDPSLAIGIGTQPPKGKNDVQIRQAIRDAFRYDPRVDSRNIRMDVTKGLVRLSGNVETAGAKLAAVQDAGNTVGVWHVEDELSIQSSEGKPDSEISELAEAALRRDAALNGEKISVQVLNGNVALAGEVPTRSEKRRAEGLVQSIRGVTTIANNLRVLQPEQELEDPLALQYRIQNRLHWNPLIDARDITVSVDPYGNTTLRGWIGDELGFSTAKQIALDTGATQVDNQLVIGKRPED